MDTKEQLRQQWDEMHGRRWIPVSERLPEPVPIDLCATPGVCVLGWSEDIGVCIAWLFRDDEGGNRWSWECDRPPTHWMPLPAPPVS